MKSVVISLMAQLQHNIRKALPRSRVFVLISLFAITLCVALRLPVLAQLPPHPATASACTDPFQCYNQGKFEEARKMWEKAAETAAQSGDRLNEIRNRINAAQALKAMGAFPRAETSLKTALTQLEIGEPAQAADKPEWLKLKVKTLRSLGETYQAVGRSVEAYQTLNCSLASAIALKDSQEMSDTYFSLGMAERAEIIRTAPRLFVLNDEAERKTQLPLVSDFIDKAPVEAIACPTELKPRPDATWSQAQYYFQKAVPTLPTASRSTLSIKADLNQFSLLMEVLPRLNQFLSRAIAFTQIEITAQSRIYFLTDYLKNSTVLTQLKPAQVNALFQTIRILPGEGDPIANVTDLARLQDLIAKLLTTRLPELQASITTHIGNLPTSAETVDMRINYAQSLPRLSQVVSQANEVNQQLQQILNQIVQEAETSYNFHQAQPSRASRPSPDSPQPQQSSQPRPKLPPPSLMRPIFKTLATTRGSLFLPQSVQAFLQKVAAQSQTIAIQVLPQPLIDQAIQAGNQRAAAAAQIALAEIIAQEAAQTNDARAWSIVEARSLEVLQLIQAKDAPDLVFRAQRQYARALSQQANPTAARAACRVAVTTLQVNRQNLVAVDQDVQYTFRDSVEPFYRDCAAALLPRDGETLTPKNRQANLEDARSLIDSLQLAELDNFFRDACLDGKRVNLDQVIDAQSPTTAVIYPILMSSKDSSGKTQKNRLGVIVKIPKQKDLEYKDFRLDFDIDLFLTELRRKLVEGDNPTADLKTVYQWLIDPFKVKFASSGVKTLVFVLDSSFRGISMAALHDGKRYLVEDQYAIAISPGLQLVDPRFQPKTELNVLAAGVSDFTNAPSRKLANIKFSPLTPVENEIRLVGQRRATPAAGNAVVQVFGDRGFARILSEEQFTIPNLTQELKSTAFNIVHLGTHGVFSSRKEGTFIATFDQLIFVDQLGDIFQKQQQVQQASIDLLVLSACQTATGDNRAILGLSGVALKAGVRSTLSTLWNVKDETTVTFMNTFYEELQNNKSKAEAVHLAQQEVLKKNPTPRVWAPYVLVGSWS